MFKGISYYTFLYSRRRYTLNWWLMATVVEEEEEEEEAEAPKEQRRRWSSLNRCVFNCPLWGKTRRFPHDSDGVNMWSYLRWHEINVDELQSSGFFDVLQPLWPISGLVASSGIVSTSFGPLSPDKVAAMVCCCRPGTCSCLSLSTLTLGCFYVLLGTSRVLLLRLSSNAGKTHCKMMPDIIKTTAISFGIDTVF